MGHTTSPNPPLPPPHQVGPHFSHPPNHYILVNQTLAKSKPIQQTCKTKTLALSLVLIPPTIKSPRNHSKSPPHWTHFLTTNLFLLTYEFCDNDHPLSAEHIFSCPTLKNLRFQLNISPSFVESLSNNIPLSINIITYLKSRSIFPVYYSSTGKLTALRVASGLKK